MSTFVESNNFKGKTVIPFCTSGSTGISDSVKTLRAQALGKGTWLSGRRIEGDESRSDIAEWADSLDIGIKTEDTENSSPTEPSEQPTEPSEQPAAGKTLVAYFSCTDTTKGIAELISQAAGADLYRINPEVPYTSDDLNYSSGESRTNKECNDPSSRPAISGQVQNMEDYKVVYIGYPIWYGSAPRIMDTFVESYDFSGKTVIPFCTSASSGIGSSAEGLKKICSGSPVWLSGRRFGRGASETEIAEWLRSLELP